MSVNAPPHKKMTDDNKFINELYKQYFFQICSYCIAMLDRDEAAALDCAHEVFDAARKCVQKLRQHPNVIGWLKLTAQHRVKRELRKRGVRIKRELNIDDYADKLSDPLQYFADFDELNNTPEEIESTKDMILSSLSADERILYTLRFQNKYTYKQISMELGLPESTARMRAMKVELKLRAKVLDTNNKQAQKYIS